MPMTYMQKVAGCLFIAMLAAFALGAPGLGSFLVVCWLGAGLGCS